MAKTKEEIALRNKLWRERRISNMTPEQKEAALAKERANYLRRNDNEKAKVATRKRDSKMTPEQRAVKVAANNTRNRNHRSNIKGTQEALWIYRCGIVKSPQPVNTVKRRISLLLLQPSIWPQSLQRCVLCWVSLL